MRTSVRTTVRAAVVATGLLTACRGGDAVPANDTVPVGASPRAGGGAPPPVAPAWPVELGGMLLVPGPNPRTAVVLLPDSMPDADALAAVRGAGVDLLGAGGRIGGATVAAIEMAEDQDCIRWPSARLQFGTDSSGANWGVATRAGAAVLLPMTAIGALPARDSLALVADLARVASGLPMDTVAAFRGLPFVVRSAHRARVGGRELLVAEVTRRVGQEATPLEERVLVVAERDSGAVSRWTSRWWDRVDGPEESIEATDAVGMLQVGGGVVVLLQRESPRGIRYELVWGDAAGWQRRWASVWSGC